MLLNLIPLLFALKCEMDRVCHWPMSILPDTWNCGLRMRRECRERILLRRAWREPSAAGQLLVFGLTKSPPSTANVLIDAVGYVCPYELFWSSFRMKLVYISYEIPKRTFEIILVSRRSNPFQMKFTWTDQHNTTYEWYHLLFSC